MGDRRRAVNCDLMIFFGAIACILLLGVMLWALGERREAKRAMIRISEMLREAQNGSFRAERYDESMLSSVENRMSDFLAGRLVSQRQIEKERDKIKELIGDISHQTKTPMANILLYGQLLGESELTPEERSTLQSLLSQTEKLNFLIDALVQLSRLETGIITLSPKANSLAELVEAVVAQVLPKAQEKGVRIKVGQELVESDATSEPEISELKRSELKTAEPVAVFDMKWTREALYNVADNAVKYTEPGGAVTLSVRCFELFARIDVEDTGCGIGEEELNRVFDRFYRGKDVRQVDGVGIGLFLSREIMSQQGGYIKVKSARDVGSVFSLYLPME